MRAIWTGSISFGLVNIPVKMYSGSRSHEGLDLNMLHKKDHARIRYARICRKDGKEIPYDEIEKGYEYKEGDFIVLNDEDFKKAWLGNPVYEIHCFVLFSDRFLLQWKCSKRFCILPWPRLWL